MARKDILRGLLGPAIDAANTAGEGSAPDAPSPAEPPATPRATRGAIGAVSRSIADLKARSVIEIDPHLIEAGGMQDRLETDDEAEAALRRSIAEYGQQVPILVRPHPQKEGRYQIVYGRRRVLAMRDLGQPVKALVRDLDDKELILAQGQENTARRDLSFIEKVNFARQLAEGGYDRKVICDALSIDKTLASRMLSVAEKVPLDVISVIGAAPSIGRDRWLGLAEMIAETETDADTLLAMINFSGAVRSDDRFQAGWDYLAGLLAKRRGRSAESKAKATRARASESLLAPDGRAFGEIRRERNALTVKLLRGQTEGFEDWLAANLPDLFADWQRAQPKPEQDH